jgi:aminoglycoside phosphotransferase (APT) family kinase protein
MVLIMAELPGVDLAALAGWLDAEHPGLRTGELTGSVIAGGKSNLTFRLTDGRSTWALRRPPLGHVLPTAHDMGREFRVISALAATRVPVAHPIAYCSETEILGAPFYLTSFVEGEVLDRPGVAAGLDRTAARRVCEQLVDTLVVLHEIDPKDVGLQDFGRPEGFLQRQLHRWQAQWTASRTEPRDDAERVVAALAEQVPRHSTTGIVHGDYRLTNVIYRPQFTGIAAVVDWEMATLGDPLSDLGLLAVYQELSLAGDFLPPRLSVAGGFLSPEDMVSRYAARSERDVSELAWYIGFGYFKLAVIAEGIHHRYLLGKTVGGGFAHFGSVVPGLLASALNCLR